MIRGLVAVMVVMMLFSVWGCRASEILGVKEDKVVSFEPYPNLTSQENYALETWYHAAVIADDVEDYTTAILYYAKIKEYFPDTKEGAKAQKRLEKLNKPQKSKDQK